jgi:hypothetical protein
MLNTYLKKAVKLYSVYFTRASGSKNYKGNNQDDNGLFLLFRLAVAGARGRVVG